MINFENYEIVKLSEQREIKTISFVGIHPNKNGKPLFILPHGFEEFKDKQLSDFFIDLYKTFKNYQNSLENRLKINKDENVKKLNDGKYEITNKDDEVTIFHSKLDLIDNIIELVEGHSFIDFNTKIAPIKPFEIKSRHLENALYQNNIAIIDEVLDNKRFLTTKPSIDILNMLVFIYSQINEKLGEKEKNRKYKNFYDSFIEKFKLNSNDKIFSKNSKNTINKLKEILEIIDKKTYYKDNLYFDIYEAIESFLYFNKMINSKKLKWGIDSFSFIWEDICQNYVFNKYKDNILFADSNNYEKHELKKIGFKNYYKKDGFDYPFIIKYKKEKHIYPDLVLNKKLKIDINNIRDNIRKTVYPTEWGKYYKIQMSLDFQHKLDKYIGKYGFKKVEYAKWDNSSYIKKSRTSDYGLKSTRDEDYNELIKNIENDISIKIIDFKYVSKSFLKKEDNKKVKNDCIKQLVYELALKQHKDFKDSVIQNYFWIPKYFKDNEDLEQEIEIENKMLNDREIKVIGINFTKLQKNYIGEK